MRFKIAGKINIPIKDRTYLGIYELLIKELKNKGASNIIQKKDKILFRNKVWRFGSYVSMMSAVDEGYFEIEKHSKQTVIKYCYYIPLIGSFIFFIFFIFLGLMFNYFLFGGCILIVIDLVFKINLVKNGSINIFQTLVSEVG